MAISSCAKWVSSHHEMMSRLYFSKWFFPRSNTLTENGPSLHPWTHASYNHHSALLGTEVHPHKVCGDPSPHGDYICSKNATKVKWDHRSGPWCNRIRVFIGGGAKNSASSSLALRFLTHTCSGAQSCPTLPDPMGCSQSGSSVHGILQARIPEWICHFLLQAIFLTQGVKPAPPASPSLAGGSLPLSHLANPYADHDLRLSL